MMTAVSTKVVTSTIDVVARTNFLVIACFLSFMTLVVIVTEGTLIASRILNNIKSNNRIIIILIWILISIFILILMLMLILILIFIFSNY